MAISPPRPTALPLLAAPDAAAVSTRLFADGAELADIRAWALDPRIEGFTTNPTLMVKSGQTDYARFARAVLEGVQGKPVSFEVIADDVEGILREARRIASWAPNVYVKVPVTTTAGEPLCGVVRELSEEGVQVNVTAVFTEDQIEAMARALADGAPSYLSVFAGRIADTGRDPLPIMGHAIDVAERLAPRTEVLWASPREVRNVVQASAIGCHIITLTSALLDKLEFLGRDLGVLSLETVAMFRRDALASGIAL